MHHAVNDASFEAVHDAYAQGAVSDRRCYSPVMGDNRLERILTWIAAAVAIGLLGAGVYAVFYSTNGSGTVALLTIGGLTLFVIIFGDRIRSMEFGGAKIQLALRVKDSLKRAFRLRLSGNYEEAEAEIELAFNQFVAQEPAKVQRAYEESKQYQAKVLAVLGGYVKQKFDGEVRETSSTVSFLPLMDAVSIVDGNRFIAELESLEERSGNTYLCELIRERVRREHKLRTAVIMRPGPALDAEKLVRRLEKEVTYGALEIDCFLLIQDCKDSDSRKEFCNLANGRGMHAKSLVWQPDSGEEMLKNAFLAAILTICNPAQCGFSQAASVGTFSSASPAPVTTGNTPV
jgi:hypothetical protein